MTCEKCWADAFLRAQLLGGHQADHYRDLLDERRDNPCAETTAESCPRCGGEVAQEYFGPCATCRDALRQLQAPAPDPLFVESERADGRPCTDWKGKLDLSELVADRRAT